MAKIGLIFISICLYIESIECEDRNYVKNVFTKAGGEKAFLDINTWRESYKKSVFDNLAKLPQTVRDALIAKANKANNKEWQSKLASQYLEYVTNGNRVNFETTDTHRRVHLVDLVIGELLTRNGTYIDQICNGLWLIMEESTWETPGHLYIQKAGAGLPDPEEDIIDLRVGEIASTVSITKLLLRESLEKVNKMFIKRIDHELHRRISYPYINNNDFWWMGFSGKRVNNHNSWDNSNILRIALLGIDDEMSRNAIVNKSVYSIDYFLNSYPEDGGCDEGPTYWGWAGGRLIDYLELLSSVSNGKMSWADNELIKRIGSFIYKTHIDQNKFVNFADAHALMNPEASAIYKFGKLFNDPVMKGFAAYVSQMENYTSINTASDFLGSLSIFISQLLTYSEIKLSEPKSPQLKQSYFPDLQVAIARSKEGSSSGLFLAAKAGTNYESHNHNDVGNFIIYVNGSPAIIDVGVGKYTNVTFSKDRYSLWSMQSQWHNCPTINGVEQKDGNKYFASNVTHSSTEDTITFSADIAGSYPKEADVKSWIRTIEFDGKSNVIKVNEKYELKKWTQPLKVHFITHLKTEKTTGSVQLLGKDGLSMEYNSKLFDVVFDHKDIDEDDFELSRVWGKSVNRITLEEKVVEGETHTLHNEFVTTFKMIA